MRKWMERAIVDFGMIEPGDRVLVAISGGVDSLALLHLLRGPMVSATSDYYLEFAHIDSGFPDYDASAISRFVESYGERLHVVNNGAYEKIENRGRKSACWICSRQRRKSLFETAQELGCNKVAMAHHRDDAIESFIMNFTFNREICGMLPAQSFFDGLFTIIRPLYYISDKLTKRFAKEQGITSLEHPCLMENKSKREFTRNFLAGLRAENPKIEENIFAAMFKVRQDYLPKTKDGSPPPKLPKDI